MIPFFAFPPAARRVIYTTNAIKSLHSQLRKIIKTRGHFPTDDAATMLLWLALQNITAGRGHPAQEWREAMNQFTTLFKNALPSQPKLADEPSRRITLTALRTEILTLPTHLTPLPSSRATRTLPATGPVTSIVLDELNSTTLDDSLLTMYEHRVFIAGVIWSINSFDQKTWNLARRRPRT